jgi:cytochrome c oxidase assembly factor CtaG
MPVAWLGYALVLWLWHLPWAYESALDHRGLHDVEHVAFFAAATLFWWPIVNPAPHVRSAVPPGWRVVYLVTAALQSAALGLVLAASPTVLYPSYAAARGSGTSALDDQALGGVVMWTVSGTADMLAVMLLLYDFLATQDREPIP